MSLFDGPRLFYHNGRKPWVYSMDLIIIIIVFLFFAFAFILIVPGIRGRARKFWVFRIITSLFIGSVTVAVNFTSDWEVGIVTATTTYKSISNSMVNADIGLHVGLNGINITLKGNPIHQINETINYNEQFVWSLGMDYNEYYNEGLKRGLPNPILYVAEKFAHFSPCGFFTQYRISGHYASACMWVAFCSWIACNVLFFMPVFIYGAYMILVTASFITFSLISFLTVRNVPVCDIKFGTASLKTDFGGSFWLSAVTGLFCFLIGITLIVMNFCFPEKMKILFNAIDEEEKPTELYINQLCSGNDTVTLDL